MSFLYGAQVCPENMTGSDKVADRTVSILNLVEFGHLGISVWGSTAGLIFVKKRLRAWATEFCRHES